MDRFLVRALVAAIGLWLADTLISGISFDSAAWLLTSAVVLGVINAIVRPLALILTLPITLVMLGLFILVLNAGMLGLASWLLPGFHVAGFWPAF